MEGDQMKLSFVIPAYNEEEYIGECLEAIVAQKQGLPYDIEVIVVNNNSTDHTEEVARRYPGVKIVEERRKGIVAARQAGFLAATGDLIANVDADTRLTRGWIRKVMEEFSEDKGLVTLSGPFLYYDAPFRIRFFTRFFYYISFALNRTAPFLFPVVQGGNFVVRRSALEKIGGYRRDIEFYGEDTDVARRMNKVGKVKFTFRLPIKTSGRRLAKEGGFTTGLRYTLNYFWIIFFGRPFTKTSKDIRLTNKGTTVYAPENKLREFAIGSAIIIILLAIALGIAYLIYHLAS
jgi:cellulose synthase/poly-beta-1,6-N-acetylglucosamine synthase-like glycosyltransferase